MKRFSRHYGLVLILIAAFAIAVTAIAVGMSIAADASLAHELGLEIAKTGIHLILLTIIGACLAQGLKQLDSFREERRRLNEQRLEVLGDILSAYNRIKAVRRTLRAFGFRSDASETPRTDQVAELTVQMKSLNEAELSLEKIDRELDANNYIFRRARNRQEFKDRLRQVMNYVEKITEEWEKHGSNGKPQEFTELGQFLDKAEAGFRPGAAEPLRIIEQIIRAELLEE